jgi:bifunctional non-homologous end joining protein LigD
MLAGIATEPFNDPEWIFENKYDGYRALANISGRKVELYSRNLHSFNDNYPSIAEELKKIRHDCILDGEVVAENSRGRSDFQLLQNTASGKVKLRYYVFDLLYLNGHYLTEVPLIERKHLLELLMQEYDFKNIIYSDHIVAKGISFYKKAEKKNLEGIIAKKASSPYRVDQRSKEWLKIKIHQQQEMIIVGFTAPQGTREHFGSLVLGYYNDSGTLVYGGNCGTGFDSATLAMIYTKAKPYFTAEKPFSDKVSFREVQWLKPVLVCQVKFSEWTRDGHLRHPVYLGLRKDKKAEEVRREETSATEPKPVKVKKASGKKIALKSAKKKTSGTEVSSSKLQLTNQDKIYWPAEKYTKGDLVAYYESVADYILPYLKDRPQSMHRFPNGINAKSFYQKDVDVSKIPSWLKTEKIYSPSTDEMIDYLICNDKETLLYMANLGCIDINPWNSRIQKPENPDWAVIDLDPEEIDFKAVVDVALAVRETLEELDVASCIKTSGATGMHIFIPLAAKYDYQVTKTFTQLIANLVHEKIPEITSLERSPSKRKKKVYLDYLQNARGQTLAAPYAVRPRPGATVSTPLEWKEVNGKLDPKNFTIRTIQKRLDKTGDLWKPVLGKGEDILKALAKIK